MKLSARCAQCGEVYKVEAESLDAMDIELKENGWDTDDAICPKCLAKVGTRPIKVTLLNEDELREFPPEVTIGDFASVCYDSHGDPIRIAKHVIESAHFSAVRPAHFRFEISGVTRAFSHQHVRHNIGAYSDGGGDQIDNQRSQRYVNEEGFDYTIPESIADSAFATEYVDMMATLATFYSDMKKAGIPGEDARMVLPNACHTVLHTDFSYQALLNYCHERLCTRAQWEIREVARLMVEEVKKVSPMLAAYLVPKCANLGYCPEAKGCGKMPSKKTVLENHWRYTQLEK